MHHPVNKIEIMSIYSVGRKDSSSNRYRYCNPLKYASKEGKAKAYTNMETLSVSTVELLAQMSDFSSSLKTSRMSGKDSRKKKKGFSEYFDEELGDGEAYYNISGYGKDARKQNITYKQKEYR